MRAAPSPSTTAPDREPLRRRAVAIVLTILAHALLLLMLLRLAPDQFHLPEAPRLTTFSLMPAPDAEAKKASSPNPAHRRSGGAPRQPPPPPQQEAKIPPPPPTPVPRIDILPLSRQEMAAADISQLHSDRGEHASGQGDTTGEGAGPDTGSTYGNVPGVGNVQLYNAEWYREPTQAELDFYLPKNRSIVGRTNIACRTIARFHVDDCHELGDMPPGTGLGYAITQAAWQFLVRPPRVNGKSLIGSWVRITYTITEREAK